MDGYIYIYTRFQYFIGILMYKFVHNLLPPSVSSMFTLVRNSHSYQTRSSVTNDIALPLPHSEMYKRMLSFNDPKVWNSVPHEMRNSSSLDQFKKSYKKYFFLAFIAIILPTGLSGQSVPFSGQFFPLGTHCIISFKV